MSEKRKRRENTITALLIAGMCIVVGGTIIFVVKYSRGDENKLLSAGMTEASSVSLESSELTVITSASSETTAASSSSETSEETTEETTTETTEEPTPTAPSLPVTSK